MVVNLRPVHSLNLERERLVNLLATEVLNPIQKVLRAKVESKELWKETL